MSDQEPRDFLLDQFRKSDRLLKRMPLALFLACIVGLGTELALSIAYSVPSLLHSGLSTWPNLGLILGEVPLAAIVGFLSLGLPRLLPGAREVRVDGTGVHLHYDGGKTTHFRWTERSCSFLLYDYGAYPLMVEQGMGQSIYGAHIWNRRTLLSREAFVAILAAAQNAGAVKSRYNGSASWYGKSPVIYKIQGGSSFQ